MKQKPQRILFHLFLLIGFICLLTKSKMVNLVQSVLKKELLEGKDENRIFP
ncbi:hypothetical protein HMPREF9520_02087 [Enterococcus faecalis TX1467]|nr:hypothetical protein HMPREF9520_02087 [Enterococcus faecalis TX1467]